MFFLLTSLKPAAMTVIFTESFMKITVIAAGFKDANKKNIHQKQSFLPKTWKAGREIPDEPVQRAVPNVVHQVQQNVREVSQDVPADDLDVPTFLRRQAQKA